MRPSTGIATVAFVGAVALASGVGAAILTVTTADDSGAGSLREAMTIADANGEADTIVFAADYTIELASTLPTVTTEITIRGNGWDRTIIDGRNPPGGTTGVRAFVVVWYGSLTLDGVMVRRCFAGNHEAGGAVSSRGVLRVLNSAFHDNAAPTAYGGAIVAEFGQASLELESTRFLSNSARFGGAVVSQGDTTIERCGFVGNRAVDYGGAALSFTSSHYTLRLSSSTFSTSEGQSAVSVRLSQDVRIDGVTIVGSTGVGLEVEDATVILSHSILAGSGIANCTTSSGGVILSAGYNLEDADACGLIPETGDLVDTDPLLGPLTDPGRPPPFHPALATSPVIDGGARGCPMVDEQRGIPRPVDGDGDGIALCDMGSIEAGGVYGNGFESGSTTAWGSATP